MRLLICDFTYLQENMVLTKTTIQDQDQALQHQDQVSQDQDLQNVVLNGLNTKTWSWV